MANRFELGHLTWPILVASAKARDTLTYGDLATGLGYDTARVTRAALWSIQDYCLEKGLPPLTSIVINKHTHLPGPGFIAWDGDIREAHKRVFDYDWSREPVPFPPGTKLTPLNHQSSSPNPQDIADFAVPDIEIQVNGRGPYQTRFRNCLLRIYEGCCALCDTRDTRLLVASHILPWAKEPSQRLNPKNGILMCRAHDALFEVGLVRITSQLSVEVMATSKAGSDLVAFLKDHTAKKVRPPSATHCPDPSFLKWRYDSLSEEYSADDSTC